MPGLQFAKATERLPRQSTAESLRLTTLVSCLVGHTVEEVERELILCSLSHYCGNRTSAAKVLGISVRTMRNKINEYAAKGRAVPAPGQNKTATSPDATTPHSPTITEWPCISESGLWYT
jgi:Bacterial regulatory protein, Fis family